MEQRRRRIIEQYISRRRLLSLITEIVRTLPLRVLPLRGLIDIIHIYHVMPYTPLNYVQGVNQPGSIFSTARYVTNIFNVTLDGLIDHFDGGPLRCRPATVAFGPDRDHCVSS